MPDTLPGLTGYVLAGGRSSRMGQDKAELMLGGMTLLDRAIGKLRPLCREVVVVGERPAAAADRVIRDLHPGCGPMGGVEAALRDLPGEWAMFLPVDMPLLPSGLLEALCLAWSEDARRGARVCFAAVDGVAQPLVSLLHRRVLLTIEGAVERGQWKLRPVLEAVGAELAAQDGAALDRVLRRTEIQTAGAISETGTAIRVGSRVWQPNSDELQFRELWFSNLNTPEEFRGAQHYAEAAAAAQCAGPAEVMRSDGWGILEQEG